MATGAGSLWVAVAARQVPGAGELVRLDPVSGQPVGTTAFDGYPLTLSWGEGRAWVLTVGADTALHAVAVDVASGQVVVDEPVPGAILGSSPVAHLAVTTGAVWVALRDGSGDRLVRLDAGTGRLVTAIALPGAPAALAGGDAVWVGTDEGRLVRVDPGSNRLTTDADLGAAVLDVAAERGSVWASARTRGHTVDLLRIDATSGEVAARTGIPVSVVETGRGRVWVANYGYPPPAFTGFIAELDPATTTLARTTSVLTVSNNGISGLAVGESTVWAVNSYAGSVTGFRTAP
ncbi:MAG: hypothetical protein ACRD2W_11020 [Acidimicrobiales bacterium]